jgi:hypothetical protein
MVLYRESLCWSLDHKVCDVYFTGEGSMLTWPAGSTNGTEDSEEPISLTRQSTSEQPVATSWSDNAMFRGVPWDEMGLPSQTNHVNNHEAIGLITLGFDPHPNSNGDALDAYHSNDSVLATRSSIHPSTPLTNITSSWPEMLGQPASPRFIPRSMSPITSPRRSHAWNDQWWQTANQSYEKIFTVGPYGSQAADMINTGTLFKAVRDGWNSLDVQDQNNPIFMILREMDEKVFFLKDKVSRVALAIKSHRLVKYYLNADQANLADLADWQRPRPSQKKFKHPIAIDFFAWPGLRDKMVKHHARYFHTTDFSDAYRKHFKFSWPFGFEDTYQYDERSDTYRLSPLFEQYHRDLKSWRFEESFFKKYPELLEAVKYVEADPVEAPAFTQVRNSTAMMAATDDFPEVTSAMGQGINRTMMEAEAQSPSYGERRSVREPTNNSGQNMSMAEQVGVEGLGDLWMTT